MDFAGRTCIGNERLAHGTECRRGPQATLCPRATECGNQSGREGTVPPLPQPSPPPAVLRAGLHLCLKAGKSTRASQGAQTRDRGSGRSAEPRGPQGSLSAALGTDNNEALRFFPAGFLRNGSHLSFPSVLRVETGHITPGRSRSPHGSRPNGFSVRGSSPSCPALSPPSAARTWTLNNPVGREGERVLTCPASQTARPCGDTILGDIRAPWGAEWLNNWVTPSLHVLQEPGTSAMTDTVVSSSSSRWMCPSDRPLQAK